MEDLRQKSGKVSKTKLEAFCKANDIPLPMYEAYGRQVCAYWFGLGDRAKPVRTLLRAAGLKISHDYFDGNVEQGLEATNISYFKAWHWDE